MSDLIERLNEYAANEFNAPAERKAMKQAADEIERLRAALREIRDIARLSEGVDFYAMLADTALGGEDE
jgi:hypothetical protein